MKKQIFIAVVLLLAVSLAGCSLLGAEPTQPPTDPPAPTEPPTVDIGGTKLELDTVILDLTSMSYEMDALLSSADRLTEVTQIELGETSLTMDQIESLNAAFPAAWISYTVNLFGETLQPDTTTSLDLSDMDVSQTEELLTALPLLPQLQEINFVNAEGVCVYDLTTITELDKVREIAPEVNFHVSFELFGQTVTSKDERIEYYLVPIGNEGAETIRAVLPYLTSCTYLLLDGCEIDNEVLAELRSHFPETKVVWRVWLAGPYYNSETMMRRASFLTDTHLIRTVVVTDRNCDVLKYCIETKYVDFGHNEHISDISFLAYMPDLEAAVLALTSISDLTPLTNCPKLEYLELFTSKVSDLTPLAACTSLEHLNISNLPELSDITPLYGLTNLKRLRIIRVDKVPQEQIDEIAQLLPECDVMTKGWDPTGNGWRKDEDGNNVPRYELLREQMQYDLYP